MTSQLKIIAVIPAYNEGKTIRRVVETIRPYVSETVVVDDCSTDATSDEARAAGASVVQHEKNKGYDASINDAFVEAALRGADIFITIDADGEHDPNDVPRILAPILSGAADIVAGQRPETRHFAEDIFAFYTNIRFGVKDPLCGLKTYRRTVYDSVGFFDSVHSIGTELMIRGIRKGFKIKTVPIRLHSRMNDSSRFYARRFRGNLKILRAMLRVIFL